VSSARSSANRTWLRAGIITAVGIATISLAGLVTAQTSKPAAETKGSADRGKHLVFLGGCNDCHTPLIMTASGPRPDSTRYLSGHPSGLKLPPPPALDMNWMAAASATMTAWAGPWGISYTANLTPDSTGLGIWTEQLFMQAMRSGKHLGVGRPIMPPMPIEEMGKLSDQELKDVWAFLRTIPPVHNQVPEYLPPTGAPGGQH